MTARRFLIVYLLAPVAIGVGLYLGLGRLGAGTGWFGGRHAESATLQILERKELLFLVTDRVTTQVVVSQEDQSMLLGGREGYLIATAKMYYGIDLQKLTAADVHELPDRVVVDLPEPELLDFSVDPECKFISLRTGLVVIVDWLKGADLEQELRSKVKERALEFAGHYGLFPDKAQILSRLNALGPALAGEVGKKIEFRYRLR